jgi:hypothetical protein
LSIDGLGLSQNAAAANIVSARFNRFAFDKIDWNTKKRLQRLLEIQEPRQIVRPWRKGDKKVNIAPARIEICSARC